MNRSMKYRILSALIGFFGLISIACAQDLAPLVKAESDAALLREALTKASDSLALPSNSPGELTELRATIEQIRTRAFTAADLLNAPGTEIGDRLKQLGPKPEGTEEAPAIIQERNALEASKARFDAAQKKLELLAVEAEQLSARAASLQRDRFFQRVFESDRSVLNPKLWVDGISALALFGQRFLALILVWWGEAIQSVGVLGIFGLTGFTAGLTLASLLTRGWILRRLEPVASSKTPGNFERLLRVAKRTVINAAVALAAMVTLMLVLETAGVLTERFARFVRAVMDGWLIYVLLRTFANSILAPSLPAWRLPELNDESAAQLSRWASFAAFIFAADIFMRRMFDVLFLPLQFSVAHSAIVAGLLCFVLLGVLTTGQRLREEEGQRLETSRGRSKYFSWTTRMLQALWLVLFAALAALLFGYVALAHFLTTQIISTGALVSVFYLLHHLADELILTGLRRNSPAGRFLRQNMSLSENAIERLGVGFGTIVDLTILFVGVPAIFLQWAVTWVDLRSWLTTAFFGFNVGGVTLSPSLLLLAISVLAAGILLTKLFTRWLDRRVLARTDMDKGVRDSVRKGVGYSGYLLATVIALTSAGLDFSNVALIAGALGVGIGFGLQSIVNNFVSGLILLAERPVKVGDWVVLAPGEGFVKRINVRATEIETFDGASIIVPNSSLIAEPVKNWTHADTRGKMVIPVSVSRNADPEFVRDILVRCAKSNSEVAKDPEPWVLLAKFGEYAHEFQLNFFVEDVVRGVFVASDLRFGILKAFQEHGLEMPYPQHQVLRPQRVPARKAVAKRKR